MGKKTYRIITISVLVILCISVLIVGNVNKNYNDKTIEAMNDNNEKKTSEKSKLEENKGSKCATWDMSNLYKNSDDWKKHLKKFSKGTKELKNYVGKVTKSKKHLQYALKIKESLDIKLEKLNAYVYLNSDINKNSYTYLNMSESLNKQCKDYYSICSSLELEILKLSNKDFKEIMKNSKISKKYSMYLNDIRRNKKHYLSSKEEKLLSNISDMSALPKNIYELFINMDKKSNLNPDEYELALESDNREERKKAYENEALKYNENINMLSGLFIGQAKNNIFYSQTRGYKNSRDMYMLGDNIDSKVYDGLINTVDKNLKCLHKYISLRKNVLNLDKVYSYDMHVPIINPVNEYIPYDKAQGIIYEALNPLGKEYTDILYKAFNERWIDVYSKENKVGGAYCLSVYDNHPYILVNYSGSLDSVSTLAHELGHAVYGYMSSKNQNYLNSKPSIFTHEVASITNEALLYERLIKNTKNKDEKAYYITQYLDLIKNTLFVQTMYAEFENIIHQKLENGESVNVLVLNDLWGDLLKKYYGKDFYLDQLSKVGWSKIPHFYNSFYVYKYATGCSAAIAFSQDIVKNGSDNYISFLKKGGSNYPIELLKDSGVNLYSTKPIEQTTEKFKSLVLELESLLKK